MAVSRHKGKNSEGKTDSMKEPLFTDAAQRIFPSQKSVVSFILRLSIVSRINAEAAHISHPTRLLRSLFLPVQSSSKTHDWSKRFCSSRTGSCESLLREPNLLE